MQRITSWLLNKITFDQLMLEETSKWSEEAQDEIEYEFMILGGIDLKKKDDV